MARALLVVSAVASECLLSTEAAAIDRAWLFPPMTWTEIGKRNNISCSFPNSGESYLDQN